MPMKLDELRKRVSTLVSPKRFEHILGVERYARRLGEALMPGDVEELCAAALLHDVTKEMPLDEQLNLLENSNFPLTEEDKATPGVIHSFSAPIVIKRDFSEYATKNILLAVQNHTVGAPDMSIFEKIIFLSDYAEDTRPYDSCQKVNRMLFDGFEGLSIQGRLKRLDEACLLSIDGALEALERAKRPINSRMYETRNSLLKN